MEIRRQEDVVTGALFSKDEGRILTWSSDGTAQLWDINWARRDGAKPDFVTDLCREKLVGASVQTRATSSYAVLFGVRHISSLEAQAAPILRDRVGEDVCAPPPTTWETLFSLLRLPIVSMSELGRIGKIRSELVFSTTCGRRLHAATERSGGTTD